MTKSSLAIFWRDFSAAKTFFSALEVKYEMGFSDVHNLEFQKEAAIIT